MIFYFFGHGFILDGTNVIKNPSILIIAVGLIALGVFLAVARTNHRLQVKTYFEDAQGLRAGAAVRVAGVAVGQVSAIRVKPEMHSAEVMMDLRTPYEFHVPSDAVATVETAGVLGEPFVQINIQSASGPPLGNGGVLKSRPGQSITQQQLMECFSNLAEHKPCDLNGKSKSDQNPAGRK
jgi:phospholipid/cholesterol/gamma-HCH transport system substrate-binding protein